MVLKLGARPSRYGYLRWDLVLDSVPLSVGITLLHRCLTHRDKVQTFSKLVNWRYWKSADLNHFEPGTGRNSSRLCMTASG